MMRGLESPAEVHVEEFLAIGRNAAIIVLSLAAFASFFVLITLWLARNTVEPEHEAGY